MAVAEPEAEPSLNPGSWEVVSGQLENPAFRAVLGTSFLAFCVHPAREVVTLGRNECAGDHRGVSVSGL